MADQFERSGRLIAIDGTRGKDLAAAADAVAAALKRHHVKCAVSRFDASGLFGELAATGGNDRHVSARSLTLLYAADLAFRLRWEIRPVLEAGGIVIAAPYVDTVAAIGAAHGLEELWIRELMRLAVTPHFRLRATEKKVEKGWRPKPDRGYGEYCAAVLGTAPATRHARRERRDAIARLQRPRAGKVYHADDTGTAALAAAITGRTARSRSGRASRPRGVRK